MNTRDRRKQDLLLASELLRLQAAGAVDELGSRAEQVQARLGGVATLWRRPTVRVAAAVVAALWLGRSLRGSAANEADAKARPAADRTRWMRWGLAGWRAWRLAAPAVMLWLQSADRQPSAPAQGSSKPSI